MPDNSTDSERSGRLQRLKAQIGQSSAASDATGQRPASPGETNQVQQPNLPAATPATAHLKGLGQPSSHDKRSQVPFDVRYKKENVMVDRRLLASYYSLMERLGRSKVESFNAMLLEVLIEAGYPLDPHLLEHPFQWGDLPK